MLFSSVKKPCHLLLFSFCLAQKVKSELMKETVVIFPFSDCKPACKYFIDGPNINELSSQQIYTFD